MTKENPQHKITKKHLKILFGIILILFSVFVLLNFGFISTAIVYAMVFLFGNLYFLPFVLLVYCGGTLIFKPIFKKVSKKVFVILGSIFLILAILMALCFTISIPVEGANPITFEQLNFSNFNDLFMKEIEGIYQFNTPIPVFKVNYGGGFIGYFLVASINTILTSHIGTICLVAALFVLALIFYCYFPIKALVIYLKSDSNEKTKNFKTAKKSKKELVVEPVVEEEKKEVKVEEDLNVHAAEISFHEPQIKSEPKNIIESKIINSRDEGFLKPSFSFFNDNTQKEEKDGEVIAEQPQVQPQYVKAQQPTQNYYQEEPKQENYYEEPVEEEIIDENNNELYMEASNIDPEPSYDYYSDDSDNQISEEEIYDDSDIGYVSEETLSNSNFVREEFRTPEPPISKPREEIDNFVTKREIISEVPEEKDISQIDVVINHSKNRVYKAPSIDLLKDHVQDKESVEENKRLNDECVNSINNIFEQLKIGAKATGYTIGPTVTRFDIFPNRDVSVSNIEKYVSDLCSRLGGVSARFEKIVQGKTSSALEIPNQKPIMVSFKEAFKDLPRKSNGVDLTVPFGKNIDGINLSANLAKFPHLLVSGATGSGKSVYVNSLLISLLMRNSPDELKLLIIDPKEVEFSRYNGIPHLLGPTVTSTVKAKAALEKLTQEMENRNAFLNIYDHQDIKDYNEEAEEKGLPKLPYIICVIDEYADLIENDKTIQGPVTRLAGMARSTGIHLIIATQRPSANVITGTIKSNIPVRIAFMASSGVDSRVMLEQNGAETLIGNGDMLINCKLIARNNLIRAQGAFLSSLEIKNVLNYLKETYKPEYDPNFTNLTIIDEFSQIHTNDATGYLDQNSCDSLYPKVREFVYSLQYCSISNLQRTFNLGFNRASKLLNQLIKDGIVSSEEGPSSKGREVIIRSEAEFNDRVLENEEI